MQPKNFVAYIRMPDRNRTVAGLSLSEQRLAIEVMARSSGGALRAEIVEEKDKPTAKRIGWDRALRECARIGAALAVARLDRVSTNAPLMRRLYAYGIELFAADAGQVRRTRYPELAEIAESRSAANANRSRRALAKAKRSGTLLGSPRSFSRGESRRGGALSAAARSLAADLHAVTLRAVVEELRARGAATHSEIARSLNAMEPPPAPSWHVPASLRHRRPHWTSMQVKRVIDRIDALDRRRPERRTAA
jgi:DNA invertase Pin-like site-specific DNA recombinase